MSEILTRKFSASFEYLSIIKGEEVQIIIRIITGWQLGHQDGVILRAR